MIGYFHCREARIVLCQLLQFDTLVELIAQRPAHETHYARLGHEHDLPVTTSRHELHYMPHDFARKTPLKLQSVLFSAPVDWMNISRLAVRHLLALGTAQ